jgi:4-amino-4-deoxy-L-arabinose transferase-like glycosyltransferase
MTLADRLDLLAKDWRGPMLAGFVALMAALPGALGLPPLDRDESRFAQASAQMLETGDFVTIRFQDTPRFKKPIGIYWLQAAAVKAFSKVESREIWAFRVPSILGAILAAVACAWGAAGAFGSRAGLLAGVMLGSSFLLSTEADIAATDAALAGAVTLAMAALSRLYLAARGGPPAGRWTKALLWAGVALSILLKGPIGPMVVFLSIAALCAWDRRTAWLKTLGWGWGLIAVAAVVGPWAMAITVATDGAFWGAAVGGDLAPKLMGGQEGHGAPPLFYAALAPFMLFPAVLALPGGLVAGWRARAEPGVRFALCWLIPAWLVFELTPTKLVHYTLPLYGALAWLMARSLAEPPGRTARWIGATLIILAGLLFAAAGFVAMSRLGDYAAGPWAVIAGMLFLLAAGLGAWLLVRRRAVTAVAVSAIVALFAHGVMVGALAPALRPLWLSSRAARALALVDLSPLGGVTPGPVTVAGYEEPSIVFLLGTNTELGDAEDAANAIAEGRPAIVESRLDAAFRSALSRQGVKALRVGEGSGLDYSNNHHDILRIYRPVPGAPLQQESAR